MAFPRISTLSTEYIRVPVKARRSGLPDDPTGDTVEFGLTPKPAVNAADQYNEPTTWFTGSWDTEGTKYLAKITVGPTGTLVPAEADTYQVWVKVTSSPEIPVMYAGDLEVF